MPKTALAKAANLAQLSVLTALLSVTACGGGGGGGSSPPPNQAPQARISAPDSATGRSRITLDGSASSDSDGSIVSWEWRQLSGASVQLSGSDGPRAQFTAPELSNDREFSFSLRVTDDDGASNTTSTTMTIEATAELAKYTLSGAVIASASQIIDGDTNDPGNPVNANNNLDSAQSIPNPITLGGYVNVAGAGADGRSTASGDIDDYFLVELLAGQTVTLLVADVEDADADLYLYDLQGDILDFSIETGEIESITVTEDGTYAVDVFAFAGATNYILAIGSQPDGIAASRGRTAIIPGEVIVQFRDENPSSGPTLAPTEDLAWSMGMVQRAGDRDRPRLMAIQQQLQQQQRLGHAASKKQHISDPALRAQWETLATVKSLRRNPAVVHAEPNYWLHSSGIPNDEAVSFQWHYPLINLPAAWDTTIGDSNIIVAVVDTGVLRNHPDLAGQLVPGYDFVSDSGRAGDGNGIDPNPEDPGDGGDLASSSFHGTHVGGTVAARGNNRIGVAGVAYGAKLMPLRALGAGGGSSYDVSQAIRFAAGLANDSGTLPERRADVINLSLGGEGNSAMAQALYREVRRAGVVVVAAAGNEGSSAPSYPAAYDDVISVSAVDGQRKLARYSNRGPLIDIAAPGGDSSADFNGDGYPDGVLSTGGNGDSEGVRYVYSFLNGTSMAAPHVAGVVALMLSVNPDLGPADIERMLVAGELSDDIGVAGRDNLYGYGLINAQRAVAAALAATGASPDTSAGLEASSSVLNFGNELEQLDLVLANRGQGELRLLELSSASPWLQLTAADTDADGLGRYTVSVDRSALAPGVYGADIIARSTRNTLVIKVLVSVGDTGRSDLGLVYLLLYDPATDEVVEQLALRANAGRYPFQLPPVSEGSYQLYAGTDADNDLFICDAGEACGAWLTVDQPALLELNRDLDGLEFPVEYQVALPDIESLASPADDRPVLPLRRAP